jgi:acyl-CoA thioester hydrolase
MLRVRYAETDAMGVVYYANYLTYFEVARVEYLRAAGIEYRALEEDGMVAAVTAAHVEYRLPAKFDDELSLWTRCASVSKVRFRVEYEIWREADGAQIVRGYTEHALLAHGSLRPTRIPAWVKDGIERFEATRGILHPLARCAAQLSVGSRAPAGREYRSAERHRSGPAPTSSPLRGSGGHSDG